MAMETQQKPTNPHKRLFGPDVNDTSSVLFVKPHDVVVPLRQAGNDVAVGDPITAEELAKEK